MASQTNLQDYRLREISSIADAEPIGSVQYLAHTGLLLFSALMTITLFDIWWPSLIVGVYVTLLTLEKAVSGYVVKNRRHDLYMLALSVLFARAAVYNTLVVSIWAIHGDLFQMAALALLVAATINIFVHYAQYPRIIACVVAPIWLSFAAISGLLFVEYGVEARSIAGLLVFICLTPYFGLSLMQASKTLEYLEHTQSALIQSQKQEALGQFVSGIAHDFNNILAITLGNAELIKDATPAGKDRLAQEVMKAAERGASLTTQLLAFSRRSSLSPDTHHIGDIFLDLKAMLNRVIPENIHMDFFVASDAPQVFADNHQLATALLNLAVNAKDAMPNGGTLRFRAMPYKVKRSDVFFDSAIMSEGDFVCIEATDTGSGITPSIQDEVFDPFFTTKPVGKGSGLGLSMVLGFAKQSGGAVHLTSQIGEGTTIRLYLPSSPWNTSKSGAPTPTTLSPISRGGGHVLLVENELTLRNVYAQQLQGAGYDVTFASNGDEAGTLLSKGLRPDILVTDLVMPGSIQGLDLARLARTNMENLPVVVMSGFPEVAVLHKDEWVKSMILLEKPFAQRKLLSTIAGALSVAVLT